MQINAKIPSSVVTVDNGRSVLTLRLNKSQLFRWTQRFALLVLTLAVLFSLSYAYLTNSPLFTPMLKASLLLGLICFVSFKSNNN